LKATGIVRRIDDLGRVVIPKEIRRTLRIREGDPLEIFIEGDVLCLQKYYVASGYKDKIKRLIANISNDSYMDNSEEIKARLNEVLELLGGKDSNDE